MASAAASSEEAATAEHGNAESKIIKEQTDALPSSTPVEMSQLSQTQAPLAQDSTSQTPPTVAGISEARTALAATTSPEQTSAPVPILAGPGPTANLSEAQATEAAPSTSAPAIGSPLDHDPTASTILLSSNRNPSTSPSSPADAGPTVLITLLLINGKRHPFKIDTRYLKKRNIFKEDVNDKSPFDISIYTLKELIWRDWREEWDPRPTVPGSIRLIFFGKVLEDKALLKDIKLKATEPNIFLMSVKPQDFLDDEENAKLKGGKAGSSRSRRHLGGEDSEAGETSAGCCRCTVM